MKHRAFAVLSLILLVGALAQGGGPLRVTGHASVQQGLPFLWDVAAMPIRYTVDGGPFAKISSGTTVISNSTGLARVKTMFLTWQSVPTTAISYSYAGPITAAGLSSDGDVDSVTEYNAVKGSCNSGTQSPVIFDANASIMSGLGLDPLIIGFAGFCSLDSQSGRILSAHVVLNGAFQDGINSPAASNYELTADEFDQAISHEIGHFSGLDHSQINVEVLGQSCNPDDDAGLPLMFPVLYCPSRKSEGLPLLAPDDVAWISKLYPNSSFASSYGSVSGFIYFSDGVSQVQGVNVIARQVDDPSTSLDESKRFAVSVISGYLFTGNPGQSITGNNSAGSTYGSRDPAVIGYYEIPVPPGTYTVQVENIDSAFVGGSGVGPLPFPAITYGAGEFWHRYESAFDDVNQKDPISVVAGQNVAGISIILNGTSPRFDRYEDGSATLWWHFFGPAPFLRPDPRYLGRPA